MPDVLLPVSYCVLIRHCIFVFGVTASHWFCFPFSFAGEAFDALVNILTAANYLDFDSLEADLSKLKLLAVTDSSFSDYLGNRVGRMTGDYADTRTNSDSTSMSSRSESQTNSLPRISNTSASLTNVADLRVCRYTFNESELCKLIVTKLFNGNRESFEEHVTQFTQKLQNMRALFVRLKNVGGDGVSIGELKLQKKFFAPFLNALVNGTSSGAYVSLTQIKLDMTCSYANIPTEIHGKSDFAFHRGEEFVTDVVHVLSLLEYKPPYGKMMTLPWVAWDQTVFQALQLWKGKGKDNNCSDHLAIVGIMDGIASGIVVAESLNAVRIYSRSVEARSVILHMLLLICPEVTMTELDIISVENGCIIFAEDDAEGAVASPMTGTGGRMTTRSSNVENNLSSTKSNGNIESFRSFRHFAEDYVDSCDCGTVFGGPSKRVILADLTADNLYLHNISANTL